MDNSTQKKLLLTFRWIILLGFSLFVNAQSPGGVSTNLKLWLDSTTGIITSSGTSISQWTDRSTLLNNATQVTTANQPIIASNVFNFNPAVQMDGLNHIMNLTGAGFPTGNTARSFFMAASENGKGSDSFLFSYGVNTTGSIWAIGQVPSNSTGLYASGNGVDAVSASGFWPSPINNNLPKLGVVTYNGTAASFYDAGSSIGTSTINGKPRVQMAT